MMVLTPKDYFEFKCSTHDVGKDIMEGLGLIDIGFEPCMYQILTSMFNANKPICRLYNGVAQEMFMHATPYDVLLE
jgi:hypothetical protein